jgi:hypothetical protein
MKFGNWRLTDATIEWAGTAYNSFIIDRSTLLETMQLPESGETLYHWIVIATQEEWLDEDDLYDLNFAFVYAAASSLDEFDYELLDKTIEFQYEMLGDEDEDEDEF